VAGADRAAVEAAVEGWLSARAKAPHARALRLVAPGGELDMVLAAVDDGLDELAKLRAASAELVLEELALLRLLAGPTHAAALEGGEADGSDEDEDEDASAGAGANRARRLLATTTSLIPPYVEQLLTEKAGTGGGSSRPPSHTAGGGAPSVRAAQLTPGGRAPSAMAWPQGADAADAGPATDAVVDAVAENSAAALLARARAGVVATRLQQESVFRAKAALARAAALEAAEASGFNEADGGAAAAPADEPRPWQPPAGWSGQDDSVARRAELGLGAVQVYTHKSDQIAAARIGSPAQRFDLREATAQGAPVDFAEIMLQFRLIGDEEMAGLPARNQRRSSVGAGLLSPVSPTGGSGAGTAAAAAAATTAEAAEAAATAHAAHAQAWAASQRQGPRPDADAELAPQLREPVNVVLPSFRVHDWRRDLAPEAAWEPEDASDAAFLERHVAALAEAKAVWDAHLEVKKQLKEEERLRRQAASLQALRGRASPKVGRRSSVSSADDAGAVGPRGLDIPTVDALASADDDEQDDEGENEDVDMPDEQDRKSSLTPNTSAGAGAGASADSDGSGSGHKRRRPPPVQAEPAPESNKRPRRHAASQQQQESAPLASSSPSVVAPPARTPRVSVDASIKKEPARIVPAVPSVATGTRAARKTPVPSASAKAAAATSATIEADGEAAGSSASSAAKVPPPSSPPKRERVSGPASKTRPIGTRSQAGEAATGSAPMATIGTRGAAKLLAAAQEMPPAVSSPTATRSKPPADRPGRLSAPPVTPSSVRQSARKRVPKQIDD
jgi:hypothetical protein